MELGTAVDRAVYEPSFTTRSKGGKSMLGEVHSSMSGKCENFPSQCGVGKCSQSQEFHCSTAEGKGMEHCLLCPPHWANRNSAVPAANPLRDQLHSGERTESTQTTQLTAYLIPPAPQGLQQRGCSMDKLCLTLDMASQTLPCSVPCDRRGFTSGRGSALLLESPTCRALAFPAHTFDL